jgi:GT2 family glycosyltransferase
MLLCILNHYNPTSNPFVENVICVSLEALVSRTVSQHSTVLIDGSGFRSERLAQLCSRLGADYISSEKKLSFAEGYNLGLSHAEADWYALCASDVIVPHDWDAVMIREANRCKADFCAPYLTTADYSAQIRHLSLRCGSFEPSSMTFNLNLISRRLLERIGSIDGQFSGCFNDIDYLMRARSAGFRAIICNAGQVVHLGRITVSVASSATYTENLTLFLAKYPFLATTKEGWDFDFIHPIFFPRKCFYYMCCFGLMSARNRLHNRTMNLIRRLESFVSRI